MDWWGAFKDRDNWPTTYHILVLYVCAGSAESLGAFSTQLNGEVHRFSGTNGTVSFLEVIVWPVLSGPPMVCYKYWWYQVLWLLSRLTRKLGGLSLNPMVRFISSHWHKCLLYLALTQNLSCSQDGQDALCVCRLSSGKALEGKKSHSQCNEVKYQISCV